MNTKEVIKTARKLASPFRITNGQKFRLKHVDPGYTLRITSEARAKQPRAFGVETLTEWQDKL